MYAQVSQDIYQGDVIVSFHFTLPPLGEPVSLQVQGSQINKVPISQVTNRYSSGNETLLVNSFVGNGMIITQTCDIQRRKYVSVCPIHDFTKIRTDFISEGFDEKRIQAFEKQVKEQKVGYFFYLPAMTFGDGTSIGECYVDLQVINSVPRENISSYSRLIGLSDKGRHWLDFKLMSLFGRPFE
ncbi:MAG: hypothetical protein ACREBJ_01545 [Nitrosotalea sp.]